MQRSARAKGNMRSMSTARPKTIEELVDRGVEILSRYLEDHRTDHLKDLAPIVVDLRGSFQLDDNRRDWSGRSTGYRQAMSDLYTRARVPSDKLDTVQAALRYHVGNLLRERTSDEELAAVGLKPIAPKERLATQRQALAAQRATAAPRQDAARLAAYAQALMDYLDENALPNLAPERIVATRLALEAVQARVGHLLDVIASLRGEERRGGRRRGVAGLQGI